jgi:hypothetical protein
MKVIHESDKEEEYIEIHLSEKEIRDLLLLYHLEYTSKSDEEFRKPLNIFIRKR